MSSSDETTTGEKHEHRRRTAIAYPNGRRMAGREVEICYQCGEAWPCEVARLRERVELLEAALFGTRTLLAAEDGQVCWCFNPPREKHSPSCRDARAALAQADDGGRA